MNMRSIAMVGMVIVSAGLLFISCSEAGGKKVRQSPGMSLVFDAAETEFNALSPLLSMSMEEKAQSIVRCRLVFCAMLMKRCADEGIAVTRERPSDGFEKRTVTQEMIKKYLDQVSKYPEWDNRDTRMIGVFTKVSG